MSVGETVPEPAASPETTTASTSAAEELSDAVNAFRNLTDRQIEQISAQLRIDINNIIDLHQISISDTEDTSPVYQGSDNYQKIKDEPNASELRKAVSLLHKELIKINKPDVYATTTRTLREKVYSMAVNTPLQAPQPSIGKASGETPESSPPSFPPATPQPQTSSEPRENRKATSLGKWAVETTLQAIEMPILATITIGSGIKWTSDKVKKSIKWTWDKFSKPIKWTWDKFSKPIKWTWDKLDYLDIGSEKYILRPPK